MTTTETVRQRPSPVRISGSLEPRGGGEAVSGLVETLGWSAVSFLVEPARAVDLSADDRFELTLTPPGDVPSLTMAVRLAEIVPGARDHQGRDRTALELRLEDPQSELKDHLAAMIRALQPSILLAGFTDEGRETLERLVGRGMPLLAAAADEEALRLLDEREIAVLVLGGSLRGQAAADFLGTAVERYPRNPTVNLVLAGGKDPMIFQDLVSEDRIYYLTQEPVLDADLVAILTSALDRWWTRRLGDAEPETREGAYRLQEIVEVARRVALQRDLEEAGVLLERAIRDLLPSDRVYHLIYDPQREVLWSGEPGSPSERQESAAVGLVSFVARTGRALLLDHIADDPRYELEADDPQGTGRERFLAVPVRGSNRRVLAVLVAVREPGGDEFTDRDLVTLEILSDQVASSFSQLVLQAQLDQMGFREEEELREGQAALFRREALGHHTRGAGEHGDVLRLSPRWTRWTYWLLLVLLASGLVFSVVFTLREWASGPALVRMQGNRDLTATQPGVISSVDVEPGETVMAGQQLARFHGAQELAELRRIEQEFQLQLINRLRNPSDRGAELALIALRGQRELAEARLAEKVLRAPFDGRVADVRVRSGQAVSPGEIVLSLVEDWNRPTLIALLPGQYRPLLQSGMPLRFEVQGYEYAYLNLTIDQVGAEVMGPAEARRVLGPAMADLVTLAGPVVMVTAELPSSTFEAGDELYTLHDGMIGTAESPVRSDRMMLALFPRLKQALEAMDSNRPREFDDARSSSAAAPSPNPPGDSAGEEGR